MSPYEGNGGIDHEGAEATEGGTEHHLDLMHSPRARGRIKRLIGAFQDSLVSELRMAGTSIVEKANHMLRDFLPRYTQRLAIPTAQTGLAYRQTDKGFRLDQAYCFKYLRTVGPDNVVCFGKHRL